MIFKLAFRDLFRNRWRSLLTAGGVATAVALLVWMAAFLDGWLHTMIRGATAVELGQIQIHQDDYVERSSIFHHFEGGHELLDTIRAVPGVTGATGRVVAHGLVGHERRSQVARLVGVSPQGEREVTVLVQGLQSGRWLADEPPEYPAAREAVLGETLARQLDSQVGDELVLFLQAADGSLGNELLTVVGIVRSGNTAIDRMSVYMHLDDVQYAAALEGRFHEIAVGAGDFEGAPAIAEQVALAVADLGDAEGLVVRAWQAIVPELHTMIELFDLSLQIIFTLIFLILALGIINTQRMSALERRREFGVLMAIGLSPHKLGRLIVLETVLLTLIGAVVGVALGLSVAMRHATVGLDMTLFTDEASFSYMGIAFSERIFFVIRPSAVLTPLLWTVGVSVLCGLWPAIRSARLKITTAISGRSD